MSFIKYVETALVCDWCRASFISDDDGTVFEPGGRAQERRTEAQADGWAFIDGCDVCPDCVGDQS